MSERDPRTTRHHDRAEYGLDRDATYAVFAYRRGMNVASPPPNRPTPKEAHEMPPHGSFEPEDWREAQARIAHALDNLSTDRKQQRDLTRHVAEHAHEALELGAAREQIAEALGMSEHTSPEDCCDMAAEMEVQS